MRNVTIRREKRVAGCAAKLKVYLEDPQGDLKINDVPCRLLGKIKNGETVTFAIGNAAARLYVIADRLSRNYCNDYYPIPEGEEDLFLSGKTCLNFLSGNAFRFDGIADAAVVKNRKRGRTIGLVVLIAALLIGFCLGFFGWCLVRQGGGGPKDFSAEGMTITLTKEFRKTEDSGFALFCESKRAAVMAVKEDFTLMEGAEDLTVEEYAELVFHNNPAAAGAQLHTNDGDLNWFDYVYTNPDIQEDYYFRIFIYKTDDAFWLVQFATDEAMSEEMTPEFRAWAKSVSFS